MHYSHRPASNSYPPANNSYRPASRARRLAGASLAALMALLGLSACDVHATLAFNTDGTYQAVFDAFDTEQLFPAQEQDCEAIAAAVQETAASKNFAGTGISTADITVTEHADGDTFGCRFAAKQLQADPAAFRAHADGTLTASFSAKKGEFAQLQHQLAAIQRKAGIPMQLTLTLKLPGKITESHTSGEITGNTVTWTDATAIAADEYVTFKPDAAADPGKAAGTATHKQSAQSATFTLLKGAGLAVIVIALGTAVVLLVRRRNRGQ